MNYNVMILDIPAEKRTVFDLELNQSRPNLTLVSESYCWLAIDIRAHYKFCIVLLYCIGLESSLQRQW